MRRIQVWWKLSMQLTYQNHYFSLQSLIQQINVLNITVNYKQSYRKLILICIKQYNIIFVIKYKIEKLIENNQKQQQISVLIILKKQAMANNHGQQPQLQQHYDQQQQIPAQYRFMRYCVSVLPHQGHQCYRGRSSSCKADGGSSNSYGNRSSNGNYGSDELKNIGNLSNSAQEQYSSEANNKGILPQCREDDARDRGYRIAIYIVQALQIMPMVIVAGMQLMLPLSLKQRQPSSDINNNNNNGKPLSSQPIQQSIIVLTISLILIVRVVHALTFIFLPKTRNNLNYLILKVSQTVSLCLFTVSSSSYLLPLLLLALCCQYSATLVYILTKQQRSGCFDSRLDYHWYIKREGAAVLMVIVYNVWVGEPRVVLMFALGGCVWACLCVLYDTLYSLLTRYMVLGLWSGVTINCLYFLVKTTKFQEPSLSQPSLLFTKSISMDLLPFILSIIFIITIYKNRQYIYVFYPDFTILLKQFQSLVSKSEQLIYIWAAVRILSIDSHQLGVLDELIAGIMEKLGKQDGKLNRVENDGHGQNKNVWQKNGSYYQKFRTKLAVHLYTILFTNFQTDQSLKSLLTYFLSDISSQKMLYYLSNTNFYDLRQKQRIQKQNRINPNSSIISIIGEMEKNQIALNLLVKDYIRTLRKFVGLLGENSAGVDIMLCGDIGKKVIAMQKRMLAYGLTGNGQQSSMYLSHESITLLNVMRKQFLSSPQLPYPSSTFATNTPGNSSIHSIPSMLYKQIEQIISQQQPLILISAQQQSLGQILTINSAASKLTHYLKSQLIGKNIEMVLPEGVQVAHAEMLKKKCRQVVGGVALDTRDMGNGGKQYHSFGHKNIVYIEKKSKYCGLCYLQVRFFDGPTGKRWLAKLVQIEKCSPFIVMDGGYNVVGVNEYSRQIGIGLNWLGINLADYLIRRIEQLEAHNRSTVLSSALSASSLIDQKHTQNRQKTKIQLKNNKKMMKQFEPEDYQKIARKSVRVDLGQLIRQSNYEQIKAQFYERTMKNIMLGGMGTGKNRSSHHIVMPWLSGANNPNSNNNINSNKNTYNVSTTNKNITSMKILHHQAPTPSGMAPTLKERIQIQQFDNRIVECSIIDQVFRIDEEQIIGYYIIKMVDDGYVNGIKQNCNINNDNNNSNNRNENKNNKNDNDDNNDDGNDNNDMEGSNIGNKMDDPESDQQSLVDIVYSKNENNNNASNVLSQFHPIHNNNNNNNNNNNGNGNSNRNTKLKQKVGVSFRDNKIKHRSPRSFSQYTHLNGKTKTKRNIDDEDQNSNNNAFQFSYSFKNNLYFNSNHTENYGNTNQQIDIQDENIITNNIDNDDAHDNDNDNQYGNENNDNDNVNNNKAQQTNPNLPSRIQHHFNVPHYDSSPAQNQRVFQPFTNKQQINELIYINGELEFRENKKLQQKYTCETHPLYTGQNLCEISEQELNAKRIESKFAIYELTGPSQLIAISSSTNTNKNRNGTRIDKLTTSLPTTHKTLLTIMAVFIALSVSLAIFTILINNNMKTEYHNSLTTLCQVNHRVNLYNNLMQDIGGVVLENLRIRVVQNYNNNNSRDMRIQQIIGFSSDWLAIIKDIQTQNSIIDNIDLSVTNQISQYISSSNNNNNNNKSVSLGYLSNLLDQLHAYLINLQKLSIKYPLIPIIQHNNNTTQPTPSPSSYPHIQFPQQLLSTIIPTLTNLLNATLPENLIMLQTYADYYTDKISAVVSLSIVVQCVYASIVAVMLVVGVLVARKVWIGYVGNCQILAYNVGHWLSILEEKLGEFQAKFDCQGGNSDMMSELGLQQLQLTNTRSNTKNRSNQYQLNNNNNTILHKSKTKPLNCHKFALLTLTLALTVLIPATFLSFTLYQSIQNTHKLNILNSWRNLYQLRLTQVNYEWWRQVMRSGAGVIGGQYRDVSIGGGIENKDYMKLYKEYVTAIANGDLSQEFKQQVALYLDSQFCQYQDISNSSGNPNDGKICQGKISNFSIETVQSYIELKQYILNQLFPQSINYHIQSISSTTSSNSSYAAMLSSQYLETALSFFNNRTSRPNELMLHTNAIKILASQQIRINDKNQLQYGYKLLISMVVLIAGMILSIWVIKKQRGFELQAILVMVECLPLGILNHNRFLIDWIENRRSKQFR